MWLLTEQGSREGAYAVKDIANDKGPQNIRFTLGYTGWEPGQLEREIQENTWLHTSADHTLVFSSNTDQIWKNSVKTIGINISLGISSSASFKH